MIHSIKSVPQFLRRHLVVVMVAVGLLLAIPLGIAAYAYASTPAVVRAPKLEHYHFRMQILVNGKAENFGDKKYQTGYNKDQCNANLPEQPIHFHDNKDQFTHIHWEGMTGGMVMKYYGWNFIGGADNSLGYKMDDLADIQKVTTHGDYLPDVPEGDSIYVYSGDERSYKKRSLKDWTEQDLEKFFNKKSNSPAHDINYGEPDVFSALFPTASAHGGVDDGPDGEPGETTSEETTDEKLTRINNLIGNVVLFVQKDAPSDQQIKQRFAQLEPLSESTCGG